MSPRLLHITSANGPVESGRVVALVLAMLLDEARDKGIRAEVVYKQKGELERTLEHATILLTGEAERLDIFIQSWAGTVCWVGRSASRTQQRKWYIGIFELHLPELNLSLRETDVQYEAIRSSGPGGQHVNKVSTAIRATHIPTGLAVVASESRSQQQNKKAAVERLGALLQKQQVSRIRETVKKSRPVHTPIKKSKPVRVITGDDFKSSYTDKSYRARRKKDDQDWKRRMKDSDE